jgi:hypothetical protein
MRRQPVVTDWLRHVGPAPRFREVAAGAARSHGRDTTTQVIVHINHIAPRKTKGAPGRQAESDLGALVTGCMMSMVEDGVLDPQLAPSLRVHLDWIHYKNNFRDPVIVRRTTDSRGRVLPLAEIAIDLRQADAETIEGQLLQAVRSLCPGADPNGHGHLRLRGFTPYRDCLMWDFNRLFWQHLAEWEAASGKGFEKALPSGSSDANHPAAVADSARKFWTLLVDLEKKHQAPSEIIGLEIGVGTGARAAAWLDRFKEYDAAAGTGFYDRIQFILGDYSPTSLERALAAVAHHAPHVKGVALDALNPLKALTAYRFKVMYVHSTNTYDNLPFDDIVRRDGRLYLLEVRAYLTGAQVGPLCEEFGFAREDLAGVVERLVKEGPASLFPGAKGVACWRRIWEAFKLEERLRALDDYE